jgi:hypothetical protein
MGGGGLGGGSMGRAGRGSDGETTRAILTPGERVEFDIKAKENETFIMRVTSEVFDPVVEVIDKAGKVLGENDDVRLGEQESLLLIRLEKAGDYKIIVKSLKSKAGGQFSLNLRRFVAALAQPGVPVANNPKKIHSWFRFTGAVGQQSVFLASPGSQNIEVNETMTPSGEDLRPDPQEAYASGKMRWTIRTEQKGEYYFHVHGPEQDLEEVVLTMSPTRVRSTTLGETTPVQHLSDSGIDVWRIRSEGNQLVSFNASQQGAPVRLEITFEEPKDKKEGDERAFRPRTHVILPGATKAKGQIVALLQKPGVYQISIYQPNIIATDYSLKTATTAQALPDGAAQSGQLAIGESLYWKFSGAPGDVVRLEASSQAFDGMLSLYSPSGDLLNEVDDADGRDPYCVALLRQKGDYLVRLSVFGGGGSGAYKLVRSSIQAKPVTIGQKQTSNLTGSSSEVWSVTGREGQNVILNLRSQGQTPNVRVFAPDGEEVSTGVSRTAAGAVGALKFTKGGVYRVWIETNPGNPVGTYSLQLIDVTD